MIEECSDLDITIAEFIIPRLVWFIEHTVCHPPELTFDEYLNKLLKILTAFEIMLSSYVTEYAEQEYEEINLVPEYYEGLELFSKYYCYLWM